jgi:phosphoglycerate dehydrogenase-like enzyme
MTTFVLGFNEAEITPAQRQQITQLAPQANIVITKDPHQLEGIIEDVEVMAGWLSPALVVQAPNLRWFQQWWAGVDWLFAHPEAVERNFILTNASGVHAICISEHIFALILSFARSLPPAYRNQHEQFWQPAEEIATFELAGKTMLLIAMGAIGSRTAHLAQAFGMRVMGVRRNPLVEVWGVDKIVGPDQLLDVLPEADFVVVTAPHTRETEHLLGKRELAQMKPGAYLINISRGKIVDEAALVEELRSGRIAGAGLDVFEQEPLSPDSPLWTMDNVLITSHYAGSTPRYHERAMAVFLDNLRRYVAGENLRNVIDKRLGY